MLVPKHVPKRIRERPGTRFGRRQSVRPLIFFPVGSLRTRQSDADTGRYTQIQDSPSIHPRASSLEKKGHNSRKYIIPSDVVVWRPKVTPELPTGSDRSSSYAEL